MSSTNDTAKFLSMTDKDRQSVPCCEYVTHPGTSIPVRCARTATNGCAMCWQHCPGCRAGLRVYGPKLKEKKR